MKSLPECNSYNQYKDTNVERLISNLCTVFDKYQGLYTGSFLQYAQLKNATGVALDAQGVILNFNRNITFNDPLNVVHPKTEGITDYQVLYADYKRCKLGDDAYRRILMLLSQTKNIPASVGNLSQVISDVIDADVFVGDAMDMKYITYYFLDRIPGWLEVCMHNYDILPRPAGMAVQYISAISRFFGFLIQYPTLDEPATRKIISAFWKSRFPAIFSDQQLILPLAKQIPFQDKYKFTEISEEHYSTISKFRSEARHKESEALQLNIEKIATQMRQAGEDRELIPKPGYTDPDDNPTHLWHQAMHGLNVKGLPDDPAYGASRSKFATLQAWQRRIENLGEYRKRILYNEKQDLRHRLHYDPKTKWYYYKEATAGHFDPVYQSTIYQDECGVWFAQDDLVDAAKRGNTLVMRSQDYASTGHTMTLHAKDIPYFQKFQQLLTSCTARKYITAEDGTPLSTKEAVDKYLAGGGTVRRPDVDLSTPLVDPNTGGFLSTPFRKYQDRERGFKYRYQIQELSRDLSVGLPNLGSFGLLRPPGFGSHRYAPINDYDDYGRYFFSLTRDLQVLFPEVWKGALSDLPPDAHYNMSQCGYLAEILHNIHTGVRMWHRALQFDAVSFRAVLDFEYKKLGVIPRRNYLKRLAEKKNPNPYELKYYKHLYKIYREYVPDSITDYSDIDSAKDTPIWRERQWLVYLRSEIKRTKDELSRLYNRNAELYNRLNNRDDLPDSLYKALNTMRDQLGWEYYNDLEKNGYISEAYSQLNLKNNEVKWYLSEKEKTQRNGDSELSKLRQSRADCQYLNNLPCDYKYFGEWVDTSKWYESAKWRFEVKSDLKSKSRSCYYHPVDKRTYDSEGTEYTSPTARYDDYDDDDDREIYRKVRGCMGGRYSSFRDQIDNKNTAITKLEKDIPKIDIEVKKFRAEVQSRTRITEYQTLRQLMRRYYDEKPQLAFDEDVSLQGMPATDLAII